MRLYVFYTMVQKIQKWPKTQIKREGGGGVLCCVLLYLLNIFYHNSLVIMCFASDGHFSCTEVLEKQSIFYSVLLQDITCTQRLHRHDAMETRPSCSHQHIKQRQEVHALCRFGTTCMAAILEIWSWEPTMNRCYGVAKGSNPISANGFAASSHFQRNHSRLSKWEPRDRSILNKILDQLFGKLN